MINMMRRGPRWTGGELVILQGSRQQRRESKSFKPAGMCRHLARRRRTNHRGARRREGRAGEERAEQIPRPVSGAVAGDRTPGIQPLSATVASPWDFMKDVEEERGERS